VVGGALGLFWLAAKRPPVGRPSAEAPDPARASSVQRTPAELASARRAPRPPAAHRESAAAAHAIAPPLSASAKTPLAAALLKLAAAHEADDRDAVEALERQIKALIKEDPKAAVAAVFAALRSTEDEQALAVVASLLSDPDLAARPEVLLALTDMAQHDDSPARRATAVRALGNVGGDVDQIATMGRADSDPGVREAAAVALGALGDRSPGSVAAAAATRLVGSFAAEADPRVRSMLLYAVRDTRDEAVAGVLLRALAQDSDASVRLSAADMLGEVAAPYRSQAVDALAGQFGEESDANFRATILNSIVSAGGLAAIPVLERIRGGSGDLQATIDDYLAGLRSGEDDMDKLLAIRREREVARGAYSPPADDRP
jgi:HEAT repeat protein